jgi:ATP-dependent RNA/DNA helicase IGHMBP2
LHDHFENLARLVELEAKAQSERSRAELAALTQEGAERSGRSLLDLVVADEQAALAGRVVLELKKRTEGAELPWNLMGTGSPVLLSKPGWAEPLRGVVTERDRRAIRVALNALPDDEIEGPLRLDLSRDEITTAREKRALERARSTKQGRTRELIEVFAGRRAPIQTEEDPPELDRSLDDTQRDAAAFALTAEDVALIHGPPGTGKTRTVVEVIRAAAMRGEKVLACAPSNTAVDNLVERLVRMDLSVVRLGHPARIHRDLVEHSLELLVERHDDVRRARKLVKEAWSLRRQADRWTRAKPAPGEKRELRAEARRLMEDARRMEATAAAQILDRADVLCTTCSVDAEIIGGRRFDRVVIDEACQCTEPSAWIPILYGAKVVLAGDHRQLPPTIVSMEAASEGLAKSLFERILETHGSNVSRQLCVQYRMHRSIMEFSNDEMYGGTLIAHESVAEHRIGELDPLCFIDTAGAGWNEEIEPGGESRFNTEEANLVAKKVAELRTLGVAAADIGVITPYAAQARTLRLLIEDDVEVDSVDGFQGREKEAIVISLVRSNPDGEIGFLSDYRRMNVALTRARKRLIVIGDSSTIAGDPFYSRMISWFERHRAYSTVWEL